ncbi:hypothetical protein JOM56_003010 [Amanita muscaria]
MKLSPANQESRPHQLKDGDILRGAEDIYKSVKIRVEVGREWQAGTNAFNTAVLKLRRMTLLSSTYRGRGIVTCCYPVPEIAQASSEGGTC